MRQLGEAARTYIKKNKRALYDKFCDTQVFTPSERPLTIFMAGSPGAGKTEASKTFIQILEKIYKNEKIVRIDADEIRKSLPNYDGKHADEFQSAASLGVEKLFDFVLSHQLHSVLDGTLASFSVAEKNIRRALNHGRLVGILYIYLDPLIAWDFTKKRESLDGRHINKEIFIKDFFAARENVHKLKNIFGNKLTVYYFEKKNLKDKAKIYYNVDKKSFPIEQ